MGIEDRPDWLALVQEEIVDPDRRIVDPHHHFFSNAEHFFPYDLADLRRDVSGHRIEQTVYVQCQEGYREDGPEHLRCVGETEWVDRIAQEAARAPGIRPRIGAIVATANLRLGRRVREVLEAHTQASPLFRGIRDGAAFDPTGAAACMTDAPALYADAAFREGFRVLGEMGLSYDAYHYHFQTPHLRDLARAFPDVTIVLDHLGTPLGVGPYADRREEIFAEWSKGLAELASCENVVVKLGGLAMPWNGFGFEARERPPTSDELVAAQGRYYAHAIECFGVERCLFESNFPVDRLSVSYDVLWNAFKKMVADASEDEQDALFRGTATRVYRLD
ncbi:MAG: amidohydrolase family protein [Spirochaetaceae bacterium]|nr:amidohydrolase family protein [Spirochaetaceae bacterium]HPG28009.1 amidohydrolase family protein [Myxococcota bacterium]